MKCSIAIIEERELFRKGTCRLLSSISWISVPYETGDVKEGFGILSRHQSGTLLADPFTNRRSHPDTLKHIKSPSPTACAAAVTDCDSPGEIAFAAENGVEGYFLKSASPSEFEGGLFYVANGEHGASAAPAPVLFELLSGSKSGETLTSRKVAIYNPMRCGKTNREIVDELHISLYTIKNHVSKTVKKRNLKNKYQSPRNSD